MKILYGVQGTGNGHTARARAMARALAEQSVEVDFLFSGREESQYFSMQAFGDYQTRKGLTFCSYKGKVNYFQTAMRNNIWRFYQDVAQLELSNYDLVLNDFEPVSAWAAQLQSVPCISISHQNAFRYPVPLRGANWLDKQLLNHFAPADYHLALHWYHFEQPILPPIVHSEVELVEEEPFVLVYLPFEAMSDISELLWRFSSQHFICFHPHVKTHCKVENIEFHPLCQQSFQYYLKRCRGVMANGGFELPSEALMHGKKLLLKPLAGQFEQLSNVATLEELGLAVGMEHLDAAKVREWLDDSRGETIRYPNVAKAIVEWLLEGNWDCNKKLSNDLWSQVDWLKYTANI
ncbi:MJ1255/VC2487 family glycosyltransferase [Vibrio sp. NTOU-M3]|uniref:MJ1255/VC2487 family glycosyltransferase n=1 Tax=Vibrio sp. NTOU-M3 TaxID=3234954 RepID=UPI00349F4F31